MRHSCSHLHHEAPVYSKLYGDITPFSEKGICHFHNISRTALMSTVTATHKREKKIILLRTASLEQNK